MTREIIILTRSAKHKQYCVAGVDAHSGAWVRLVTDDEETRGALSYRDIRYADRTYCEVLDQVVVPVIGDVPSPTQPENVMIERGKPFLKQRACTLDDVHAVHPPERHGLLLGNAGHCVPERDIASAGQSLAYVLVQDLLIRKVPGRAGVLKTKADFLYQGQAYRGVAVTDSEIYILPDRTRFRKAALVLSLPGMPYQGYYFKYIAQVFVLDR